MSKTIAFTICSNNYLSKAKVLVNSIKQQSQMPVYLFLADQKSEYIDYNCLGFDHIILPEDLGIKNLQWQLENYNIVEFNTAIKGPAFKYLINHTDENIFYYFDPDIKVYKSLQAFDLLWQDQDIFLTPHILAPVPFDNLFPGENLFLNHGTYNLGFLGIKRSTTADKFLDWWCERLAKKCIIDLKEGYFTDQIWFNLVPLLFKNVQISNHPGLNAAYWNAHDRKISYKNDAFKVNDEQDLFFYHFSSFDKELNNLMPSPSARFNFDNRPEFKLLYNDYKKDLDQLGMPGYERELYYNAAYPLPSPKKTFTERLLSRLAKELKK